MNLAPKTVIIKYLCIVALCFDLCTENWMQISAHNACVNGSFWPKFYLEVFFNETW
jgi:hypothetical protein